NSAGRNAPAVITTRRRNVAFSKISQDEMDELGELEFVYGTCRCRRGNESLEEQFLCGFARREAAQDRPGRVPQEGDIHDERGDGESRYGQDSDKNSVVSKAKRFRSQRDT